MTLQQICLKAASNRYPNHLPHPQIYIGLAENFPCALVILCDWTPYLAHEWPEGSCRILGMTSASTDPIGPAFPSWKDDPGSGSNHIRLLEYSFGFILFPTSEFTNIMGGRITKSEITISVGRPELTSVCASMKDIKMSRFRYCWSISVAIAAVQKRVFQHGISS